MQFKPFPKLARLNRDIVITEKLDGTNAQVTIVPLADCVDTSQATAVTEDNFVLFVGSRNRWITPGDDNFGFAAWVRDNAEELAKLGEGSHFGEWWGKGIQRGYGLEEKRFSLFNTGRWYDEMNHEQLAPSCCDVVPILYMGPFDQDQIDIAVYRLNDIGSAAVRGFMKPEGIVVYHTAANMSFKITCDNDEKPKSLVKEN